MSTQTASGGISNHPLYQTWYGMLSRCEKPQHVGYYRYGARGIAVCHEWRSSFARFVSDVGMPPSERHTLDRIDNDGNYEPGNVRWATPEAQVANRSMCTRMPPANGASQTRALPQLRETFVRRGLTQASFSRSIGMSASSVFQILRGHTRPDHHNRLAIERLYGIPAVDWMTDIEWIVAFGRPRSFDREPVAGTLCPVAHIAFHAPDADASQVRDLPSAMSPNSPQRGAEHHA